MGEGIKGLKEIKSELEQIVADKPVLCVFNVNVENMDFYYNEYGPEQRAYADNQILSLLKTLQAGSQILYHAAVSHGSYVCLSENLHVVEDVRQLIEDTRIPVYGDLKPAVVDDGKVQLQPDKVKVCIGGVAMSLFMNLDEAFSKLEEANKKALLQEDRIYIS
jgi:hypothetical protein